MSETLEELQAKREKRLLRLRLYAVAVVEAEGPSGLPLGDLLTEMKRVHRSDADISEALGDLQSFKHLFLTTDRRMVLGEKAKTPPAGDGVSKPPVYSFTENGPGMALVKVTSDAGEFTYHIPTAPIEV